MDRITGNHFKRILIATDGSENAERAASYGIDVAKSTGAEVDALYVVSTEHAGTARTVMGWTDALRNILPAKEGFNRLCAEPGEGKRS